MQLFMAQYVTRTGFVFNNIEFNNLKNPSHIALEITIILHNMMTNTVEAGFVERKNLML
jgi:hypothetical protein